MTLLNGGKRPTFSKYGTTEWRNAVVLWVNIGGGDYNNVFLDGARRRPRPHVVRVAAPPRGHAARAPAAQRGAVGHGAVSSAGELEQRARRRRPSVRAAAATCTTV